MDSTGIEFLGDGEWQARKHGLRRQRQWRKVHLAMDPATSDIRAVEFTPGRDGDSPVLPELPDQIPRGEEIGTVAADGADDTRRCHTAIIERQATAIMPIRKNRRPWTESLFENPDGSVRRVSPRPGASILRDDIPDIAPDDLLPGSRKSLAGPSPPHFQTASEDGPAARARNETLRATRHHGRAFRKRWTGYHLRSRIEAGMPSQVRSNLWR